MKRGLFTIEQSSDSGGESFCWVEKKKGQFYFYGNELGLIAGPCDTILDALFESLMQFGMDDVTIECTITPEELREFLQSPAMILENVSYLTINDVTHETIDVDAIVKAYAREQ